LLADQPSARRLFAPRTAARLPVARCRLPVSCFQFMRRVAKGPAGVSVNGGGFTLIEVMVALAVLALMMVVAWGSVNQTLNAKRRFGMVQDRYREARTALLRVARDLSMAYLSGNEDRSLQDTRTFFVGAPSGDIDAAHFSTMAHTPLYADANESEQTVVAYSEEPDPDDRRKTDLIRRETRRLANESWDAIPGEADVLFHDVTSFKLAYFDTRDREWKESWTTAGVDTSANRLPDRVRVTLVFPDPLDPEKEVKIVTQVRPMMQEVLQFYAN